MSPFPNSYTLLHSIASLDHYDTCIKRMRYICEIIGLQVATLLLDERF